MHSFFFYIGTLNRYWQSASVFVKTISIVALTGLIYLLFSLGIFYFSKKELWFYVPESVVAMTTIENSWDQYEYFHKQSVYNFLQSFPAFEVYFSKLDYLKDQLIQEKNLVQSLKKQKIHVSFHAQSQEGVGAIVYLPMVEAEKKQWENLIQKLRKDKNFRLEVRQFKKITIFELYHANYQTPFSIIKTNDFWIGTFRSLLLEDIIRRINEAPWFYEKPQKRIKKTISQDKAPETSVYIYPAQLSTLLAWFKTGSGDQILQFFNQDVATGHANIKISEQNMTVQASFPLKSNPDYLEKFKPNKSVLKELLPAQTAYLQNIQFTKAQSFFDKDLQNKGAFYDVLYKNIANEIAVCWMGRENATVEKQKLVFINCQNIKAIQQLLEKNSQAVKVDTSKIFKNLWIKKIGEITDLKKALSITDEDFESVYFTIYQNVLVLANQPAAIQQWHQSIQSKKLLTNHIKNQTPNLLKSFESPSQITIYMQSTGFWFYLLDFCSESWKKFFIQYETELKNLHSVGIFGQFQENVFECTLISHFQNAPIKGTTNTEAKRIMNLNFTYSLNSPPYLFKNPGDNSYVVLVQEENNRVSLVSQEGIVLWQLTLSGTLVNPPSKIDLYKNGKSQFCLATADRLYIITEDGELLKGFPIFLPESGRIQSCSSWETTKGVYLILTHQNGNVYMYDNQRHLVKGWGPRKLSAPLKTSFQILNFKEQSFVLAALDDARLILLDLEGKMQKGFPIQLNAKVNQLSWLKINENIDDSYFMILNEKGELIQISLKGQIQSILPLPKLSIRTKFKLLISNLQEDALASIQNGKKISILNKEGELLFEKEFYTEGDYQCQYLILPNGIKAVAVQIKAEGKTYLYDLKGKEIIKSFASTQSVDLVMKNQKIIIFSIANQILNALVLN